MKKKERSSSGSSRQSRRSRESSRSRSLSPQNKIFVSRLDSREETAALNKKIRELFETKCTVETIDVKRSFDNEYCYAFVEIKENNKLAELIEAFNGTQLGSARIRVEKQKSARKSRRNRRDSSPRRNRNCYSCNKEGHFARECPNREGRQSTDREGERERERRRSREREHSRSKKRKRHTRSSSSDDDDSSSSSRRDRKGRKKPIRHKAKREDKKKKKARRHHSSSSS